MPEVVDLETRNIHVRVQPTWNDMLVLRRCTFHTGSLGAADRDPATRLHIRNVIAKGCRVNSTTVGPVVFEDVHVENLRSSRVLWLPGCAFIRCSLRGRIGQVINFATARPLDPIDSDLNQLFIAANETIHGACPWALDITEGEFACLDIRGVPASKIRINHETQVKVSYQRAAAAVRADTLNRVPRADIVAIMVEQRQAYPLDFVLATHRRDKQYAQCMELFAALRESGLLIEVSS